MKRRAPDDEREVASAYAEHASRVPAELLCTFHSRTQPLPVTTRPSGITASALTASSPRPSSAGPVPGSAGSHTSTRSPPKPPLPVTTRYDRLRRHRRHPSLVAAELGRAGARLRRVPHQHPPAAEAAAAEFGVAAGDDMRSASRPSAATDRVCAPP